MARYRDIEEDKKRVFEITLMNEAKAARQKKQEAENEYQGTVDAVKKGDPKVRAAIAKAFK